ncbi:MAG: Gx transporter family protein [Acidaminococcales bacterium]|jgi:heptaprenyl diphosphate synthase|nr:Gx transporter family protein [Acidaminococcales bacterium]
MPYRDETRRLVLASVLAAIGVALNIAESALPFLLPVPGAKMGLANIATLMCLYLLPLRLAVAVIFLRVFLASLLTGSLLSSAFLLSLAGGAASLAVMILTRKIPRVSLAGVSLAGAAAHNTGQLLAACLVINNRVLLYYLPPLLIFSLPAGLFTGFAAQSGLTLLERAIFRAGKS